MSKKTIVLGATPNEERYAYKAVVKLLQYGHEVVPVGIKAGSIKGLNIETNRPALAKVDTLTLYVGPANQKDWYSYILGLNPKRIIFNPGTENDELMKMAQDKGIETIEACTLVMLSLGNY
jgi:predicted CoA-binding protein